MPDLNPNNQKGIGILELVIATGITVLVIGFMMMYFTNFEGYQKHQKLKMSIIFIKNFINNSVHCEKTILNAGGSCTGGDDLKIISKSANKPTLIRIGSTDGKVYNYRRIGRYMVRARCEEEGNKIQIDAVLVNQKKQAIEHPIYKTKGWIPLYVDVPFKCTF